MLNQNFRRIDTIKLARKFQIGFLFAAVWFIFWAHIYEITIWNKTFSESLLSSLPNVFLYSISILAIIYLELHTKRLNHFSMQTSSDKTQEHLQKENEQLKYEMQRSKKFPSNKIGIALVIIGALLLYASFSTSSTILAFIGLGLTFWGAIFLFARSTKFVKTPILDATTISTYTTLDRIIDDLNYKGNALYIPSYPKGTYLPEYLEGLKEMLVFISAKDSTKIPAIEEIIRKQFLVKNPEGICISPPGSGLVSLFEKELGADLTKIDKESFYNGLPTVIVNNLELASNFEIEDEKELIHVKVKDSVYSNLYSKNQKLKSVNSIGCPLTSAVACAIAKTTGKLVTITKIKNSSDLKTVEVWYQLVEG